MRSRQCGHTPARRTLVQRFYFGRERGEEATAQIEAFGDTWMWAQETDALYGSMLAGGLRRRLPRAMLDALRVCADGGGSDMALTKFEAAWNGRSGESVAQAYAPDGVRIEYALPGARLEGREAIATHTQNYIHAVPDCVLETFKETRGEDGTVTLEWIWRGTHTGELPDLPARGAKVELHGVSVCEMEGDLIKNERVYWDGATLLAGAGVLG